MAAIGKDRTVVWVYVSLAAITMAAYGQVMGFDFVGFDDPAFTTENNLINRGISRQAIRQVFTNPDYYCMQLSVLSHMLDCELFGLDPRKHHLTNLIFHFANIFLLFYTVNKMTGTLWPSAFLAALFAVHPLNVESVAWIAERRNVLSTFFWLLATLVYIRYIRNRGMIPYLLMTALFIFGLLSKAMLVTFPFTLLLLDIWPLKRISLNFQNAKNNKDLPDTAPEQTGHRLSSEPLPINSIKVCILEKLPLMVISIVASYLTMIAAKNTGGAPGIGGLMPSDSLPLHFRIANALISYSSYLIKTIWPFDLSLNYPLNKDLSMWTIFSAVLFLSAVSFVILQGFQKRPWLAVGWLWYLGTLVPVIGIIQLGHQAMADRYVYVPLIGIFIMIAWTFAPWTKGIFHQKKIIGSATIILILSLTMGTWLQTRYWRNTLSLFERVIEISPNYTLAYYNMGVALRREGRRIEAFQYFSRAVAMSPDFAEANFFMGLFLSEMNQTTEAMAYYQKVLAKKPDMAEARLNLSQLLIKAGKWDESEKELHTILSIRPNDAEAFNSLGNLYMRKNQPDEAIRYYLEAIRNNPVSPLFHNNLGAAYEKKSDFNNALKYYSEAIRLAPSTIEAYNNIAVMFFKNGNVDEAFRYFDTALRINPNQAQTYYNMAVSYSKLNCIDEAVRYYSKVLEISPDFADAREKRNMLWKLERSDSGCSKIRK